MAEKVQTTDIQKEVKDNNAAASVSPSNQTKSQATQKNIKQEPNIEPNIEPKIEPRTKDSLNTVKDSEQAVKTEQKKEPKATDKKEATKVQTELSLRKEADDKKTPKIEPVDSSKQQASRKAEEGFIEYIEKNNVYHLPLGTLIYSEGNNTLLEVKGKKTKNLSQFLYGTTISEKTANIRIGLPITGAGSGVQSEYKEIAAFMASKSKITFLELEHTTSSKIALCTFFRPQDAAASEALLKQMTASMPFLVNIFRRPQIHLRQAEIVQPVDAVKRVNHLTVRHLSQHTEHWKDVDERGQIVPARLLTRVYEDDYSIYENVVFKTVIDKMCTFLQKRIFALTQILETFTDSIKLDAVNMFNHRNYYLAIGKLYVGFYAMDDSTGIKSSLDTARFLYKQLNSYKGRAVYVKNAKLSASLTDIRQTNILSMHKDYRHVFMLGQAFKKQAAISKELGSNELQTKSQNDFAAFLNMMLVFAANNFNLECITEDPILIRGKLTAAFQYKDWELCLMTEFSDALGFDVVMGTMSNKGNKYTICIIPNTYLFITDPRRKYEFCTRRLYMSGIKADKYVFFEPYDSEEMDYTYLNTLQLMDTQLQYAVLPLSITDINSFRRIQKILLEMMVQSNRENDICPFCGAIMQKAPKSKEHGCSKCKMVITNTVCGTCKKPFKASFVNAKNTENTEIYKDFPELIKQEKLYHFRNITNMQRGKFLCPHCGAANGR